jgi:hypothetical protein
VSNIKTEKLVICHVPTAGDFCCASELVDEIAKTKPRAAMAPSTSVQRVFIGALQMIGSAGSTSGPVKSGVRDGKIEEISE